jgi:hypothetical protein
MTQTTPEVSSVEETKHKKIVDRSAAYPTLTLLEAFNFVANIYKNFPTSGQIITREDVAAINKKKAPSIQRDVSTASQFKFFIKHKGGYEISPSFRILRNAFENEKPKLWLEAFHAPKLYADLVEKFDGHVLPPEINTHLIRYHDIAEKAAPNAVELFISNAKYCGAMNESNILNFKQALSKISDGSFKPPENLNNNNPEGEEGKGEEVAENKGETTKPLQEKPTYRIPEMVNSEKITIRLTGSPGRIAILQYPIDITTKDVAILQKQIEQLQIIAESQ